MEFSSQQYWNGLPGPSPRDLPDPGIEPVTLSSPALEARFFTTSTTWEAPCPPPYPATDTKVPKVLLMPKQTPEFVE